MLHLRQTSSRDSTPAKITASNKMTFVMTDQVSSQKVKAIYKTRNTLLKYLSKLFATKDIKYGAKSYENRLVFNVHTT